MRTLQIGLLGLLAGCAQRVEGDREPQAERARVVDETRGVRNTEGRVFGSLETSHGTITVELADEGKLYTLVAPDGKNLAHRVDAKHLEEHFPEVYALILGADGELPVGIGYVE